MKIQVLFGSQNDERVFGPLCHQLEKVGEVKFDVASAHRHPDKVREIMTTSPADVFVAGAGLAAHLPGVVASLTKKPVFGVAVNGAFSGLDSFLSIAQMPKDIPVMAVMESHCQQIAEFLTRPHKATRSLKLSWNPYRTEHPVLARVLQEIREISKQEVEWVDIQDIDCQGEIVLTGESLHGKGLSLYVSEKSEQARVELAFSFFEQAQRGGFWVGLNNTKNFVLQIEKLVMMKG